MLLWQVAGEIPSKFHKFSEGSRRDRDPESVRLPSASSWGCLASWPWRRAVSARYEDPEFCLEPCVPQLIITVAIRLGLPIAITPIAPAAPPACPSLASPHRLQLIIIFSRAICVDIFDIITTTRPRRTSTPTAAGSFLGDNLTLWQHIYIVLFDFFT